MKNKNKTFEDYRQITDSYLERLDEPVDQIKEIAMQIAKEQFKGEDDYIEAMNLTFGFIAQKMMWYMAGYTDSMGEAIDIAMGLGESMQDMVGTTVEQAGIELLNIRLQEYKN